MDVNDFDHIAPVYDRLARLVFGGDVLKSQLRFLDQVKSSDRVLILGGGTGQLLEHLPKCKEVDFVEKSSKMITRAKSRKSDQAINFIHKDFFEFETNQKYDMIICPFFLDCFNPESLYKALHKTKSLLSEEGKLIVSDFDQKGTGKTLSCFMHLFFRVISNLQSKQLGAIHSEVIAGGFSMIEEEFFNQNMIFSRLYRNL
ncbi:MAG: class I SAM-dependent methyltransferase [Ekhidna sp.]|uniref:class I SAM-dependent methyltransferase n=1 Tax=Ekhidna sp. TaxID=2608089 RepID=UPI0032EDAEC6